MICNQFGVRGYPNLQLLKEGKAYTFRGPRSLDNLVEFANSKYADAQEEHIKDIPKRVEGMEKIQKESVSFIMQVAKIIDGAFEKVGLNFVPKMLRYVICAMIILTPSLGICYLLVFDDDLDEPVPRKKTSSSSSKVS